jgi:hypothetical protein
MSAVAEINRTVFPHPNMIGFLCPVCQTSADAPVVLMRVRDVDDRLCECAQVHQECFEVCMKMLSLMKQKEET